MKMIPKTYDHFFNRVDITQEEVDRLLRVEQAYGYLRTMLQGFILSEAHKIATGDVQPEPMEPIESYMERTNHEA